MSFGLLPAARTRNGWERSVGIRVFPINVSKREKDLIEPDLHRYTDIFAETVMTARDDFDPLAPQREAAFFYGLFLRGHSVETLRQDIDVPPSLLDKWLKARDFEESFRESLQRVYSYRKQVLAIFDGLVWNEQRRPQLQ
jgi:hypothetical protein